MSNWKRLRNETYGIRPRRKSPDSPYDRRTPNCRARTDRHWHSWIHHFCIEHLKFDFEISKIKLSNYRTAELGTNLPQLLSSLRSGQSTVLSHRLLPSMHWPLSQRNWSVRQSKIQLKPIETFSLRNSRRTTNQRNVLAFNWRNHSNRNELNRNKLKRKIHFYSSKNQRKSKEFDYRGKSENYVRWRALGKSLLFRGRTSRCLTTRQSLTSWVEGCDY